MSKSPDCFGSIFPDLSNFEFNSLNNGKVFSFFIKSEGIGVQEKRVDIRYDEWGKCRQCSHYDSCYDFSNAKLAILSAVKNI